MIQYIHVPKHYVVAHNMYNFYVSLWVNLDTIVTEADTKGNCVWVYLYEVTQVVRELEAEVECVGVKGTKECCLIGTEFPETDAGADSTTVEFHSVTPGSSLKSGHND